LSQKIPFRHPAPHGAKAGRAWNGRLTGGAVNGKQNLPPGSFFRIRKGRLKALSRSARFRFFPAPQRTSKGSSMEGINYAGVIKYALACYGLTAAISFMVVGIVLVINKLMGGSDKQNGQGQ
jgi:hypothetical protein